MKELNMLSEINSVLTMLSTFIDIYMCVGQRILTTEDRHEARNIVKYNSF